MKPSNILNAWIKADYDEIQPPSSTTSTKKPNLIVEVQNLLARAHTHSNNASVVLLFSQMRQMVTVYHSNIGPQFCALPIDLQNHILLWYRDNFNALEPVSQDGTSLIQAILDFATSTGLLSLPVYSMALSLLENLSQTSLDPGSVAFPLMEAFSSALQEDYLTKLAMAVPSLPDNSYFRDAIFELGHGQSQARRGPTEAASSKILTVNLAPPNGDILPDMLKDDDMEIGLENLNNASLDHLSGMEEDIPNSQLLTSSQHDMLSSTMDIDASIPILPVYEQRAILSDGERNKILELKDKLSSFDSAVQSQLSLEHADVGFLITCTAHKEAIELLEIAGMSDESILALMTAILNEDASFARLSVLLSGILLPRVISLIKPASRILINALSLAGEKEPRVLLDAVLIPSISQKEFGSPHVELLIRIIKGLQPPLQEHYLTNLFSAVSTFNYSHLDFISKVIPLRARWPPEIIQEFISQLHTHINDAIEGPKVGEKFETLVWSILQKYTSNDLTSQKEKLKDIVIKFKTPFTEKNLAKLQQM